MPKSRYYAVPFLFAPASHVWMQLAASVSKLKRGSAQAGKPYRHRHAHHANMNRSYFPSALLPVTSTARWLALTLTLALAVPQAGAFSLGDIRTESFLGGPLRASVPLRLEPGELIDNKCVRVMQDQEDGIGLSAVPLFARVELDNLQGRIRVFSRQSLNEPVLRFSLVLQCGGGLFAREYTLLLDPAELSPAVPAADPPTGKPARGARQGASAVASEGRPVRRGAVRKRPAATTGLEPARKFNPSQARLELSTDADVSADTGRRNAGFSLRLSSRLDLERPRQKPSANEQTSLQQRVKAVRSDDDMAEILRLRNQIEVLEGQLATLRQTVLAGAAAPGPSPAPELPAGNAADEPLPTGAGPMPSAQPAGIAPAVETPAAGAINRPINWADVLIWLLAGAVTLGLGYMLWLYRSQQTDDLSLPDLFDDAPKDAPVRPDQPISRKLVHGVADTPASPDQSGIVVPDKDRWAIEEAQILLAQGWQEQAIHLLREQIEANPYQLDIWLMLFEIHHKAGNTAEFAEMAERFHGIAKGLPVWNSIRQMGQSLDPLNTLYSL